MTFGADGGLLVPGPRCDPWPSGLLSAAELDERPDNTWFRGLEFEQLCVSGAPSVSAMPCPPPLEVLQKGSHRGFGVEYSDAFVVFAGYDCSTAGTPIEEAWDRADELLEGGWRWGLERAFWLGLDQDGVAFRMSLVGSEAEDLTPGGGAVDITSGVAALERRASGFPCRPTIHAMADVGNFMSERSLLQADGDGWRTVSGSRVALGAGYPGYGPDGSPPPAGETWLFSTGGVRVTTGPRFFAPERGDAGAAITFPTNDVTVFAEQGFAVQIGCDVAAVRVTLDSCCA